ncbi:ATP-binding protein [Microcella sp.]|uniref:ATP-binding protein n=1 Tax=Microcella sp. TaxID=1913979 RepID=UPI00299F5A6F|nr:ATP-binding protein [Microcella sp.]MDX2026173.1 ATP-binding protein [Microcella sp.]
MFSAKAGPRITLIDGRSGSGKTTFATALARATGAQLLSLDDVYPGWDGLEAGEAHVLQHVLRALAEGHPPRWRSWNWVDNTPGEWHDLDPDRDLIIEGCGAISPAARELAHPAIWVDLADDAERRRRAIARDGELFARNWSRWARQEQEHAVLHDPRGTADEIVDGSAL